MVQNVPKYSQLKYRFFPRFYCSTTLLNMVISVERGNGQNFKVYPKILVCAVIATTEICSSVKENYIEGDGCHASHLRKKESMFPPFLVGSHSFARSWYVPDVSAVFSRFYHCQNGSYAGRKLLVFNKNPMTGIVQRDCPMHDYTLSVIQPRCYVYTEICNDTVMGALH